MSGKNIKELQRIAEILRDKLKHINKGNDNIEKEAGGDATEQDLQINSDSEREAIELFDNVVPSEKKQPSNHKNKIQQAQSKPHPPIKQPQNTLRSILRQPVAIEVQKTVPQSQPMAQEQSEQEVEAVSEREMEVEEEKKPKAVSFNFDDNLIFSLNADRKWKDVIENQKKGKFELYEQKALSDAIGQYLATNEIKFEQFVQWLSLGSKEEKHLLRKEKFFKLLASVLPNRSPMSCYKFVTRNYNSLNHQGQWTVEEVDKLKSLVEKFGRQWTRIGKELGRTSDNVYDKYRSLGEEGLEERVKNLWKLRELIDMLLEMERQTGVEFIDHNIKKQLLSESMHDGIEEKEMKEHRYNSKQFTFHNIEVIRTYIDAKLFQSIQLDTIKWKKIVKKVPTKNYFDCRNKVVQILQVLFRNNQTLDQSLIRFLEKEKPAEECKLDWRRWRDEQYSAQEGKNRFMILKKLVEGRGVKTFRQIYQELIAKIRKLLEKKEK